MKILVAHNSYHTLDSIRFILPNGHMYDTSDGHDYVLFQAKDAAISDSILSLQKQILSNEALVQKIKRELTI